MALLLMTVFFPFKYEQELTHARDTDLFLCTPHVRFAIDGG